MPFQREWTQKCPEVIFVRSYVTACMLVCFFLLNIEKCLKWSLQEFTRDGKQASNHPNIPDGGSKLCKNIFRVFAL